MIYIYIHIHKTSYKHHQEVERIRIKRLSKVILIHILKHFTESRHNSIIL